MVKIHIRRFTNLGFTLIELMVVLLIVGITIGIVGFSVSSLQGRNEVQPFVERLYQKMNTYGLEAMALQSEIGLSFYNNKIEVLTYSTLNKDPSWMIKEVINIPKSINTQIKILEPDIFSKNIAQDFNNQTVDNFYNNNNAPEIMFSSGGALTPFNLIISHPDETNDYVISGEYSGQLSFQTFNKDPD